MTNHTATCSAYVGVLNTAEPSRNVAASPRDPCRIHELDGIRAIAIWMVLVAHFVDGWPTPDGTFRRIPGFVMVAIRHGWLGVDLFFILSGFLITGISFGLSLTAELFPQFLRPPLLAHHVTVFCCGVSLLRWVRALPKLPCSKGFLRC